MHAEQRARAHDLLSSRGIQRAIFANPATVTWLTGFAAPVQVGPSPFEGGPPLVWYEGGNFKLIVIEGPVTESVPAIRYRGYTYEAPIISADQIATILRDLVSNSGKSKLGVEARHLPAFLTPRDAVSIDGLLTPLRMVKTTEELDTLRRSFALTDIGHAAARKAIRPGLREIDVWAAITSAVEKAAGQRVPLGNDCVVSTRENNIGGWPGENEIRAGDSLMVDLSVRWHGYWSDSCAVCYASEPTSEQIEIHRTVEQALSFAISYIKPGLRASDIDQQVRKFIAGAGYSTYPHHTGHGVGVLSHEAPRIVPYNDHLLEAGMVIMIEPGIYFPKERAARVEDAVLVTATGCEVLTKHDKGLPNVH